MPWPIQGQNKYHYTLTVKEKGPRKKFSFKFPNVILPKREQTTVKNIQWNLEEFQDWQIVGFDDAGYAWVDWFIGPECMGYAIGVYDRDQTDVYYNTGEFACQNDEHFIHTSFQKK